MKKNEAVLYYKGNRFIIWQNDKNEWVFLYDQIGEMNTLHKDLQPALNIIYESIEEKPKKKRR